MINIPFVKKNIFRAARLSRCKIRAAIMIAARIDFC